MTFPFPTRPRPQPTPEVAADPYPGQVAARLAASMGWTEPLGLRESVPDDFLRRLARGDAELACGQIPEELGAELAMLLPDMAGELLARRAAADLDTVRAAHRGSAPPR
jgi:hypothetical protein